MSEKVLCEKSDLVAIADAVREATGSAENYNVSELSAATVEAIAAGGSGGITLETCTVTISGSNYISGVGYSAFVDGNIEARFNVGTVGSIDVIKGSALVVCTNSGKYSASAAAGDITLLNSYGIMHLFDVMSDGTITVS